MSADKPKSHEPLQEGVVFHVHGVTKIYQMGEVQVQALHETTQSSSTYPRD